MGELEAEDEKTRSEIASHLRELADQLDGGGDVTLELIVTTVRPFRIDHTTASWRVA